MSAEAEATRIDDIARALRELDAARARVERDAKQVQDETRRHLIAELLPVLDNFDRTIAAADREGGSRALVDGAKAVRSQLEAVLRHYGVARVDAIAKPFDPAVHDAISVLEVTDPSYDDVVIDQVQPAYLYGDTLLRPAKVVVGRYARVH
jgi:molecular chaperone GrpE